jgi:hypothetical protein
MKLKHLQAIDNNKVPDHISEEIERLTIKFENALSPLLDRVNPNITLAAICYLHAALFKHFVSDDLKEVRKGAFLTARALIKNIQILSQVSEEEFFKDEN